jgi:hypothetical protein
MTKRMAADGNGGGEFAATAAAMAPANGTPSRTTRTTLVLPETLDQNLELFAVKTGLPKGEIIKKVLSDFLTTQGLQPDKRPKSINVVY